MSIRKGLINFIVEDKSRYRGIYKQGVGVQVRCRLRSKRSWRI